MWVLKGNGGVTSLHLPLTFNGELLGSEFIPLRPGDGIPGGPPLWAILQGASLVVQEGGQDASLPSDPLQWYSGGEPVCIGIWQGRPLFALSIAADEIVPAPYTAVPFHGPEARLDDRLSTLAGLVSQILYWERRSRFCPACGGTTERIVGTWGKRCLSCREEHFPHIHPCIIVLVRRGDQFLLVSHHGRGGGRYSLIAGFLDFGESLEECVRREVQEEAGVEVKNVRYVGSQNWPFPSQQMIGFVADYAGGQVRPDGVEIADARWFSADELPTYPGGVRSIARWILLEYGAGNKGLDKPDSNTERREGRKKDDVGSTAGQCHCPAGCSAQGAAPDSERAGPRRDPPLCG